MSPMFDPWLMALARGAGLVFTLPVLGELAMSFRTKCLFALSLAVLLVTGGKYPVPSELRYWLIPGELLAGASLGLALRLTVGVLGSFLPAALSWSLPVGREARLLGMIGGGGFFLAAGGDHLLIRALWALPAPGATVLDSQPLVTAITSGTRGLFVCLLPLALLLFMIHLVVATSLRSAAIGSFAGTLEPLAPVMALGAVLAVTRLVVPGVWIDALAFVEGIGGP